MGNESGQDARKVPNIRPFILYVLHETPLCGQLGEEGSLEHAFDVGIVVTRVEVAEHFEEFVKEFVLFDVDGEGVLEEVDDVNGEYFLKYLDDFAFFGRVEGDEGEAAVEFGDQELEGGDVNFLVDVNSQLPTCFNDNFVVGLLLFGGFVHLPVPVVIAICRLPVYALHHQFYAVVNIVDIHLCAHVDLL